MMEQVGMLSLAMVRLRSTDIVLVAIYLWVGGKQGPANIEALQDGKQSLDKLRQAWAAMYSLGRLEHVSG